MNCKKCGAVISDHNSFCPYCGGGNDPVNMGSINDEEISVSESKAELNTGKQVEEVPLENSPILAITFLIALISGLCVFGSIQYEKAQNNKIQEMSVEDKTVEKKESSASTTVAKERKNVTADDKNDTKKEKTVKKSRDAEAKSKSTDTAERPNTVQELFKLFLGGQEERTYKDETGSDSSIMVGTETPSENNNYAHFYIAGRGFLSIYDSDLVLHDETTDSWFFESYGFYYMIISEEQNCYSVYYSDNPEVIKKGKGEICGMFRLGEQN